jgi:thiol:disulfide interchange protein DsbC
MVSRVCLLLAGLLSATASYVLPAQQPAKADPRVADPRVEIASKIPGTKPEDLRPSPIQGIYELTHGADIAYVSSDGKYVISGDLYDLAGHDNLTEQHRRDVRAKLIATVPESEMLVFGPKDPKYTVTVFTDVDCGYCRKLHSQIAEYNRLGIRVRYLFYPRSGPNTESWTKAEEVWCSTDRNEALTAAKLGQELKAKPCTNNPVARHYALGRDFDLRGTPAIVMASGEMLPGYLPPAVLAQHLRGEQGK